MQKPAWPRRALTMAAGVTVLATAAVGAQRPTPATAVRQFVKTDAPVVALTHARVIDGTGAPARADQTLIVRGDRIAAVGASATTPVPDGAAVIDLQRADRGEIAAPAMDATAPYLEGPNTQLQMHALTGADDARRQVEYWSAMGATSFKAYMNITRAELGAAIDEAHKRGLKVTGHLCSVTYAEAADLGIDDLEHGFMAATDFVADKQPDVCPGQAAGQRTIGDLDPAGAPFQALVKKLVDEKVALTSTLTVFETFTPGRPLPPGIDVLVPELKQSFEQAYQRFAQNQQSIYKTLLPKGMALERAFAKAGGLLVAGTDPTGSGGVIPGFSDQRQMELLVEAGFTPLEAISICTLNGAKYLGRDSTIGTIASGKQADLVIVAGDPSTTIADVRKVETVFRQGIGYDPVKLIQSVAGRVGLW